MDLAAKGQCVGVWLVVLCLSEASPGIMAHL
jgi:hypothetical protein